ncbi:formin-like protein 6, partial [Tanacetum coccineum]
EGSEQGDYKAYLGDIISQYKESYPEYQFIIFNFREGEKETNLSSALSKYLDHILVIEYPREFEGCPFLSMEVITHFVKSGDNWLSASQQHIILMLSEVGGWPVLAFMVAALLLHRKSYTIENKALKVVHKQVPSDLLLKMVAMNPIPSRLRYLQYVSRRNGDTEWPPPEKALTLNCVIMRMIPDFNGKGSCYPVFRIYGRDPLLHVDRSPKLLFSTPRKRKNIRYYNQAEKMDTTASLVPVDLSCFEMEGLLEEAFGQVQEMFSSDDWVVPKRSRISGFVNKKFN